MTFAVVLSVVLAVTLGSVALLLPVCVGRDRLRDVAARRDELRRRAAAVAPFLGGLGAVLLVNKGLIRTVERFSYAYGVEATLRFYAIEGDLVATLQSALPDWGLYYFAPMYVFGYAVLLGFPLVAYAFADSLRPLKTLVTAYAVNYAAAVVCYAAVVAYGPRNYHRMPGADPGALHVEEPLLDHFREVTQITARVNVESNVFPSLHAALSVTVLLVALTTHEEFPRWTGVAAVLAGSILLATMYLGIHWATDLVAGAMLATGSVAVARRLVSRYEEG